MSHRPAVATPMRAALALLALLVSSLALVPSGAATATAAATAAQPMAATQSTGSGRIVYACGADLCAVDPVSGATARVTTDGRGYTHPSISRDGSRIAAASGLSVVAGPYGSNLPETWAPYVEGLNDVAISPDGASVAASYWYTKLELVYSYVCGGMCLELVHYNAAQHWAAAGGTSALHTGSTGVGFLGSSLLSTTSHLGTWNSDTRKYEGSLEQICVVANPADDAATCDVRISEPAEDPATGRRINFNHPTGSPDGTLVAAVVSLVPEAVGGLVDNPIGESPVIRIYDATSGARVAEIPGGGVHPTFSPDSSQLAYQGTDGAIHVVPARGGTPRKLVAGTYPTWGAGSVSGQGPNPGPDPGTGARRVGTIVAGKKALPVKRGRIRLTVACPRKADKGCAGRAGVRVGKKVITATRSYKVKRGKKSVVTLKVTKRGLKALKRNKTVKATAELLAPGARKPTVTKRIKLRRR